MEIKRKCALTNREDRGQMTIEFVVAFPAALIIGLIVINALLFFSECASFDRSFRSLVCTYAPSPSYEQEIGQTCALISESLKNEFSRAFTGAGYFSGSFRRTRYLRRQA